MNRSSSSDRIAFPQVEVIATSNLCHKFARFVRRLHIREAQNSLQTHLDVRVRCERMRRKQSLSAGIPLAQDRRRIPPHPGGWMRQRCRRRLDGLRRVVQFQPVECPECMNDPHIESNLID